MNVTNVASEPISDGTNPVRLEAERLPMGIGYIILDKNKSREDYIKNCKRTNTINIISHRNEVILRCLVSRFCWDSIVFPEKYDSVGSCVVWINIPINNQLIIIGNLPKRDEVNISLIENEVTHGVVGGNGDGFISEITHDGNTGKMSFNIEGYGAEVVVKNEQNDGIYKIYVQGDIEVHTEKYLNIHSNTGFSIINVYDPLDDDEEKSISEISYKVARGFNISDEFGNRITTAKEGINIVDNNENVITTYEDGIILLDKTNNKISMNEDGIILLLQDEKKKVRIITKDTKPEEPTLLGEKTLEIIEELIKQTSDLCIELCKTKTIDPISGNLLFMPDNIVKFNYIGNKIRAIKSKFENAKSKTLKTT